MKILNFSFFLLFCYQCVAVTEICVSKKKVFIASDHRGFELKKRLLGLASSSISNLEIEDLGPYDTQATDYTLKASSVVDMISSYQLNPDSGHSPLPNYSQEVFGVLICMDGIGMDIAGNCFGFPKKIFTANCRSVEDAVTAREHNGARILALGSQFSETEALEMMQHFISTPFAGDSDPIKNERHLKRLSNLTRLVDKTCVELTQKSTSSTESYRSYHESMVGIMAHAVSEQFSSSWKRAQKLLEPMIELSSPCGPYSCSSVKSEICAKQIQWRPYRDEVGETRVTSFRCAIVSFWTRIIGIEDHDTVENDHKLKRSNLHLKVDVFKQLFIEKIQPFLIKKWKVSETIKGMSEEKVNLMFWDTLRIKYSNSISILRASFGSKEFFGRFASHEDGNDLVEALEEEHLPFIAFFAEEILYPITSYTDHGYLCYSYLNQRNVLSTEADKALYKAHICFTLAVHRALVLLKLADINSLSLHIPEESHCSRFLYRTLTLPGSLNSFDSHLLRLSLQVNSFSTHPIGALLVFQTVWCIRLRDDPSLTRTMIISPSDDRLSRVAGLSKHPSEFEVIVPAFSEYIISVDPNTIHHNNVGWTELIQMFKTAIIDHVNEKKLENLLFSECGNLVKLVLEHEQANEETRTWARRNIPNYAKTVQCMYDKISKLASEDGIGLASAFIPEFAVLKNFEEAKRSPEYQKLLSFFWSLKIEGPKGESVQFWQEIKKQFLSAYQNSSQLQEIIKQEHSGDIDAYLLKYSASLCVELWWFGFKFVDEQLQRSSILSKPATITPKYFYAVIFSFGIIIPFDSSAHDSCSLSLEPIAEGTTSLIGIDKDGWVWKLYKTENACTEPLCPCDKRDIFTSAKHEHEISSILFAANSRQEDEFVAAHFIEAVLAGQGYFDLIEQGRIEISYLKMKQTKGDTFYQFITKARPQSLIMDDQVDSFTDSLKNFTIQGLEILEFLKKKKIIHMDFHESNAVINEASNGQKNLVLIDFGLSECYDAFFHDQSIALLTPKSFLPTVGKGRFPVSPMFTYPLYVHDLQIFCTRFIENGILGMSSRLPSIFERRKLISSRFPRFGKYLSFVKDILEAKEEGERSFLEQISEALLAKSRILAKTAVDPISEILVDSFSHQLYLNMKMALNVLEETKLTEFLNLWIKTFYIDNPDKIGISQETDFPTSYTLLEALKKNPSKNQHPNQPLSIVVGSIRNFVSTVEEAYRNLNGVYRSFLDIEPVITERIERTVKRMIEIRRQEIKINLQTGKAVRADPIPRAFVSCQGSYNPPTKAHLYLAQVGRIRALDLHHQNHPEDADSIECNESNIFGILSTIATFEVMEKDYPQQSFTVEERQGFLRHLIGTKMVNYSSGDAPYEQYADWSWLFLDYSGHSQGAVKNSSQFLAEAETIKLIFVITFAKANDYEWKLSEDVALKLQELRSNIGDHQQDLERAHERLLEQELSFNFSFDQVNTQVFNREHSTSIRKGLFWNEKHFRYIENIYREVLISSDRLKNKGNFRLFAISGEPKNSKSENLYLGMSDFCPRDFKTETKSFNVSSTKIRKFIYEGGDHEPLKFIEDSVSERINALDSLFKLVERFEPGQADFTARFLGRLFVDGTGKLNSAMPRLTQLPLKGTVFRDAYTPLPMKVSKLTMFLQFESPEFLADSPLLITGILNVEWNALDYPNGPENLSDLLALDGRRDFIELLDLAVLDENRSNLKPEYYITDDKLVFSDEFIRSLLKETQSFRLQIKAKVRPLGKNRSGRGFYLSGKQPREQMALTLMEPFGFSNLFYMQDRPDVLAWYEVILLNYPFKSTIFAGGEYESTTLYQYLRRERLLDALSPFINDQEIVIASDKQMKPTYLFQLILLPFESESELLLNEKIIRINRDDTSIWLVRESVSQVDDTSFALDALQKVMSFDEAFSGHVYDSKNLTLVSATDFNSGAREMRNFMVFSPSKLLAGRAISTLDDFYNVERIVAHEYLHHVSGNRTTMRDFFEVSLKEGLTVLRDMYFRENGGIFGEGSRIEAVTKLRRTQWVQDSGPKAHPVRPNSIENKADFEVSLFTTTVYEKGAEIVRMIQELIEPDVKNFSRLLANYFAGPVRPSTIVELVQFFELERRLPLGWFNQTQFMKWFSVKGTPSVTVDWQYLAAEGVWELSMTQITRNGHDKSVERSMLIPIRVAYFKADGEEMKRFEVVQQSGLTWFREDLFVLHRECGKIWLRFEEEELPFLMPSINRGFTAPIKVEYAYGYNASFLIKYESDRMSRFDAFQFLIKTAIFDLYQGKKVDRLIKEIADLVKFRFSRMVEEEESSIFKYWEVSHSNSANLEQDKLELALSLEEMYLSNLVEDFDTVRYGQVDPVRLSLVRTEMQRLLSVAMFETSLDVLNPEFLETELDPISHPGTTKLDQVLLRTYVDSRIFADRLSELTLNPSMERQMALLECRYRLSKDLNDRLALLEGFHEFIRNQAKDHPVAKEKLFKFVILKSETARELEWFIQKFDLLQPTQPQSLKLFAKEFASNNLSVFHSTTGLAYMAEVISNCDKFGNHETAATLIKHSFEVNLLKLDAETKSRVMAQLNRMLNDAELSLKLVNSLKSLLKQLNSLNKR